MPKKVITGANVRSISRRDLLGVGVSLALTPVAMAGYRTAQALAQSTGEPQRGGTLVNVISADPSTSNIATTTSVPETILGSLIYEGLTRIEDDFSISPDLAESWTVSEDGLVYTFKLVEAKWHDGEEFTSADVKFSIEEVSAKYAARFKAAANLITSVETPDPRTVVITLSEPFGPMLFSVSAYGGGAIVPAHLMKGTNILENPASLDKPVGTGPFMLKEWVRGDHLVLEKNPNYWRTGKPYLDRIILKIIPDAGARVLAMRAQEVDYSYFYFFPPSRLEEAKADPNLQVRDQAVPQNKLLIWNTRIEPFSDVRIRQALFHAFDSNYIKKVVYHDLGKVQINAIDSRISWGHDPSVDLTKLYAFDLERAKALLDEAGATAGAGGRRFTVRLAFDSADSDFGRMAQVIGNVWGQIGVQVEYEGSPRNANIEKVFANWDFDATIQAYSTAGDPALGVSRLYVTSAIEKRPFLNASGYSNPEVDRLFSDGARNTDLQARGAFYKQLTPILARDLPVYPIWETASINVASSRVQGKWAWSTGYSHWEDVWLDA